MVKKFELYNEDFRNKLQSLDKDVIVITDPPYNIGFGYNQYSDNMPEKEYIGMIREFANRKLAIIHYPEESMRYFVPALGVPDEVNMWCYNSNLPGRQSRLINYYNVLPDYNRVLQPYKNPNDKRIKAQIAKGKEGTRSYDWFQDIQLVKNVSKTKYTHPCPVPVALMERIIQLISNEGDTIVDPFMGSASTGIACLNTNRNFIGFEIDNYYYNMSVERMNEHSNLMKSEALIDEIERE